jgi:regulatory protein
MDLLARREHSLAELRSKLIAREFDADAVDSAVNRLAEEGLVDDRRFAEAFVASRVRTGQGPVRIRAELERRGVPTNAIETSLGRVDIDWNDQARAVCIKKFGPEPAEDYRQWARQAKFLQYRGFTGDQINAALGEHRGQ